MFDYSNKKSINGELKFDRNKYFVISSFMIHENDKYEGTVSNYVFAFFNKNYWNKTNFKVLDTEFNLVKKKNSKIGSNHWKDSISKIWKYYYEKFGSGPKTVSFVELDWAPISGGPLGENVLAIFKQDQINEKHQEDLASDLGWSKQSSTLEYVKENYSEHVNPWEDYLLGTYAHELAHLYFGFGLTAQNVKNSHELWFSLGMGMLYDIEITKALTKNSPSLFLDSAKIWNKYSKNNQIDQSLVKPDISNDKKFKLNRKKVYAHSKAHAFLKALRKAVGEKVFDLAIRKYIRTCDNCYNGYEDFKKFLSNKNIIKKIEREYNVYY